MTDRRTPGFTALELAIAITVVGILAAVAVPNYVGLVRNVRAAQAVADIQAVRAAVYMYYADHQAWPPEGAAGAVPPELAPYLPPNVMFYKSTYRLDWDNWIVYDPPVNGAPPVAHSRFPSTGIYAGISLISNDPKFLQAAKGLLRNATVVTVAPNRTTLVVVNETGSL